MLGVNEPLCVEIYVCQCWHKKHMLGTCVFAERLKNSNCIAGHPPIPEFPKSTPALFSTASPSFLEKGAYLAVIYWKVVVDVVLLEFPRVPRIPPLHFTQVLLCP